MRTFVFSLLLWVVLGVIVAPYGDAQTINRDDAGQVRPNLGDLIFREILRQRPEQADEPTRVPVPDRTQPESTQPERPTIPTPEIVVPQPQPRDTEAPVIRVTQSDFTGRQGEATITAFITDNSGRISRALIAGPEGRRALQPRGGREFSGSYPLPANYQRVAVTLQAWDASGNRSRLAPVSLRRVPVCGRAAGVSLQLVRSVQGDLNRLGGYGLGVDGIAGTQTCRVIEAAGIEAGFDWPWLARLLRQQVATAQIALEVVTPAEIIDEIVPLDVSVTDPGRAGVVRWVTMRAGEADQSLPYEQRDLTFRLRLREGERRQVTFLALGATGGRPYAEKTVEIYRLPGIVLGLEAAELIGGTISTENRQAQVLVTLSGTPSGQITYGPGGQGPRRDITYSGSPVEITLDMPGAGRISEIIFQGRNGRRVSEPVAVRLERLIVAVPEIPPLTPWLAPSPAMDQPPVLVADMPPVRAVDPLPLPRAASDKTPVEPQALPEVRNLPAWLVPAGIVVGLLLCWSVAKRFMDRDKAPRIVPDLRVVAVPDRTPEVEVRGADLPGLVFAVEPGARSEAIVAFEKNFEGAAE